MTVSRGRPVGWLAASVLALTLGGCASTSILPGHHAPAASRAGNRLSVVRHWARALRSGHVSAAADLFAVPSVFANGGRAVRIHNRPQAVLVNASLSCGAQIISASPDGRYLNVLFRLVARRGPGGGPSACGAGIGESARADFLIRDGLIQVWLRAPSRTGDPGVPPSGGGGGSVI